MIDTLAADVLVAGGGVGGLMAALRAQEAGARVVLLGGSPGASYRISSLNAALSDDPRDEPADLFTDIVVAGGFINNVEVIAAMAERIGPEVRALAGLGVPFHREARALARRQAAGSTWTRAVFTLGMAGVDISRCVLECLRAAETPAVRILEHAWLLDLSVRDGAIAGGLVYLSAEKRWVQVTAPAVVLATGGAGHLFGFTTNPPGSRGIGYALALEAGTSLIDMEFISFEPFIVAAPPEVRGRDLPTTVLREGARLRNGLGEEFFDTQSAPSKDRICRAMLQEVQAGRGTPSGAVYYDLRGMAPEIVARYVQIEQVLHALHLPPAEAQLEVMPAQHYVDGGVRIDRYAASDIPGLYAVGEVAGGAHGAHRLAAGGGTEVVAVGAIAGEAAAGYAKAYPASESSVRPDPRPELLHSSVTPEDEARLKDIRSVMDTGCGIRRDEGALRAALARLDVMRVELAAGHRLRTFVGRTLLVAMSIAKAALARRESRGDHFRTDYPRRDDAVWLGNLRGRCTKDRSDVELSYQKAALAGRVEAPIPPVAGDAVEMKRRGRR